MPRHRSNRDAARYLRSRNVDIVVVVVLVAICLFDALTGHLALGVGVLGIATLASGFAWLNHSMAIRAQRTVVSDREDVRQPPTDA